MTNAVMAEMERSLMRTLSKQVEGGRADPRMAVIAVLKALEENITDEMLDAGATCDPSDGVLPIFTAMIRAAREE